jgi:hypothetical protein
MVAADHELAFLLSLDGYDLVGGYAVKIEAREVTPTRHRPRGIKYSLTLHDTTGRRIYGMDNAHAIRRQPEYDHRHLYGRRKTVAYHYRGPAELLTDFYREVERILAEKGVR